MRSVNEWKRNAKLEVEAGEEEGSAVTFFRSGRKSGPRIKSTTAQRVAPALVCDTFAQLSPQLLPPLRRRTWVGTSDPTPAGNCSRVFYATFVVMGPRGGTVSEPVAANATIRAGVTASQSCDPSSSPAPTPKTGYMYPGTVVVPPGRARPGGTRS
eukprot:248011-Rhodomonas_salina.1